MKKPGSDLSFQCIGVCQKVKKKLQSDPGFWYIFSNATMIGEKHEWSL